MHLQSCIHQKGHDCARVSYYKLLVQTITHEVNTIYPFFPIDNEPRVFEIKVREI